MSKVLADEDHVYWVQISHNFKCNFKSIYSHCLHVQSLGPFHWNQCIECQAARDAEKNWPWIGTAGCRDRNILLMLIHSLNNQVALKPQSIRCCRFTGNCRKAVFGLIDIHILQPRPNSFLQPFSTMICADRLAQALWKLAIQITGRPAYDSRIYSSTLSDASLLLGGVVACMAFMALSMRKS